MRRVLIAPGVPHAYDAEQWADALVIVEHGQLELEWSQGARLRFGPGDVLWLAELALWALHCPGPQPTVLVAWQRWEAATPGDRRRH